MEAKKTGSHFIIPKDKVKRKYKINGTITTDKKINNAINQAAKYTQDVGATYTIVSNGNQFIIFQGYKRGGKWRDADCLVFKSLEDIKNNYSLFWNILSKENVQQGSLQQYISEKILQLDFKRPLDYIHNEDASVGKNILARNINPLINKIFSDLTDSSQINVLEKCYIKQREVYNYNKIIEQNFDKLPHYSEEFDIEWFKENELSQSKFQLSFEKCQEFLRTKTPTGSLMILLGGIGSGKTTFIHHFFKITMKGRKDILWFYVDFTKSPLEPEKIESYIYESIIDHYNSNYSNLYNEEFKRLGLFNIKPDKENILKLFAILNYMGNTISLVLDNVDQHSYISPRYQESVFEFAQHLTPDLRTITILNLREESFFRATRSGVLDAYLVPKYHISSPSFESLIRKRLEYAIELLNNEDEIIQDILGIPVSMIDKDILKQFFNIINNSIRRNRRVGKEILQFINDISGGNMRQSLRFFNTFMTSANTDVNEMFYIESRVPKESPQNLHYQIPLHHIIKSIILGDYKYYSGSRSFVMNLFQLNPAVTHSHFISIKILDYLNKRKNHFFKLDIGFIPLDIVFEETELSGIAIDSIKNSLSKLAEYGLIEYDNQNKEGLNTAEYIKLTQTGKYYIENLIFDFTYLDLILFDTLISDDKLRVDLKNRLIYDEIKDRYQKTSLRFKRTKLFLNYLKNAEENDFIINPFLLNSEFSNQKYMDKIIGELDKKEKNILEKMTPESSSTTKPEN